MQAQLYSYVRLWTLVLAAAAARSESRTRANRTMVVRRPSSMRRSMHRFTTAAILLLVACWSYLPTTHAALGSGGTPFIKKITSKSGYTCVHPNGCLIRCTGEDACMESTIRCDNPTGPCLLECTGKAACKETTIQCNNPAGPCLIECTGGDACQETIFAGSILATSHVVIRCSGKA